MNIETDLFDKIQDRYAGRLSLQEEIKFKAEYEKSPELRKACEEYEIIRQAMRKEEKKTFLAHDRKSNSQGGGRVRIISPRFLMRIAAGFLLLTLSWIAYQMSDNNNVDSSFADAYTSPTTEDVIYIIENTETRGLAGTPLDTEEINALFREGTESYRNEDMKNATLAYRKIIEAQSFFPNEKVVIAAKFYLADILLRSKDVTEQQEALLLLQEIEGKRIYEKISREHIQWHIALALVKNNQQEEARKILTKIVNKAKYDSFMIGEESIRERARMLLTKLK